MTDAGNPFEQAVEYLEENITDNEGRPISRAQIMYILGCTPAYFYRCMKDGQTGIGFALKLEHLTHGVVSWQVLCPKMATKVKSTIDRVSLAFISE